MTYPKKNLNKTNKKPTNKVEPNRNCGQQLLKKKLQTVNYHGTKVLQDHSLIDILKTFGTFI